MNLNHLHLFRAVAETGGFSRAAARIHISQPAISMQVGELEKRLGVALFHRSRRGVKLTDAGNLLLSYAQRIAALEADAERAMAEIQGISRGRLAIGASTTIGVYLLPALLGKYRTLYPHIDLQFDIANTEEIENRVADGTLDAALTEGLAPKRKELESLEFRRDRLVAIGRPDHPGARKRALPITLAGLCSEQMIVRESGSGTRTVVENAIAKRGLRFAKTPMVLGSTEAIKRAVAAGLGVAIVSDLTIQSELTAGTIAVLPIQRFALTRPLYRLTRRNTTPPPPLIPFLSLLNEEKSAGPSKEDGSFA